ncbi:Fc.00g044060.m01.CDS01 [Cosmosporella sp. VM-42]
MAAFKLVNFILLLAGSLLALATPIEPATLLRYIDGPVSKVMASLTTDNLGIVSIGEDGVLRSIAGDMATVIDYRQLDPVQYIAFVNNFADAAMSQYKFIPDVDGRLVLNEDQLLEAGFNVTSRTDASKVDGDESLMTPQEHLDSCVGHVCKTTSDCQPYCLSCFRLVGSVLGSICIRN